MCFCDLVPTQGGKEGGVSYGNYVICVNEGFWGSVSWLNTGIHINNNKKQNETRMNEKG